MGPAWVDASHRPLIKPSCNLQPVLLLPFLSLHCTLFFLPAPSQQRPLTYLVQDSVSNNSEKQDWTTSGEV